MQTTNHQIKQAVNRLMNEFVGDDRVTAIELNTEHNWIWISHRSICVGYSFVNIDKDLSLNVTKTILKIKKLIRDTAHSN